MRLTATHQGFFNELQKISTVRLDGLSPETILSQKPPEPLETLGARKALDLIDMAQAKKTASISSPAMSLRASQKVGQPVMSRAKNGPGIKAQIRGSLIGRKGTLPPE